MIKTTEAHIRVLIYDCLRLFLFLFFFERVFAFINNRYILQLKTLPL